MDINQSEEAKTEDNTKSVSIELNETNFKNNQNKRKDTPYDYIIIIKKLPLLGIKYFKFGKTLFFYCCCSLKESQYKLSKIPTPSFTIGPECK